jgi:hypothetical protein
MADNFQTRLTQLLLNTGSDMVLYLKIISMTRANTKIGDVFSVKIDASNKKYFQYIANDLTQLNSDVIRSFKKEYLENEQVNYEEILRGEIDFHAHTMINVGIKQKLFHKEGNYYVFPNIENIVFRGTLDYGKMQNGKTIQISKNWRIWHINDKDFIHVGVLTKEHRESEIGIIMPPFIIIERIKRGKFNFEYPGFE